MCAQPRGFFDGATAVEAIRLEILPIRSLRVPGYESTNKTVAVRHRDSAAKSCSAVGSELPLAASECLPLAKLEGKVPPFGGG